MLPIFPKSGMLKTGSVELLSLYKENGFRLQTFVFSHQSTDFYIFFYPDQPILSQKFTCPKSRLVWTHLHHDQNVANGKKNQSSHDREIILLIFLSLEPFILDVKLTF